MDDLKGDTLRDAVLQGESLRVFAERAGVAHTIVFNFVQRRFLPKTENLMAISKASGIPLESLVDLYKKK